MPLRRTPHHPDLARWLVRGAWVRLQRDVGLYLPLVDQAPRRLLGSPGCRSEVKEEDAGARRAPVSGGHERRHPGGPSSSPIMVPVFG